MTVFVRRSVREWTRKRRSVPLPRGISSPKRGWARGGAVPGGEEREAEEAAEWKRA